MSTLKEIRQSLEDLSNQQLVGLYKGLDLDVIEKAIATAKKDGRKAQIAKLEKQIAGLQTELEALKAE